MTVLRVAVEVNSTAMPTPKSPATPMVESGGMRVSGKSSGRAPWAKPPGAELLLPETAVAAPEVEAHGGFDVVAAVLVEAVDGGVELGAVALGEASAIAMKAKSFS